MPAANTCKTFVVYAIGNITHPHTRHSLGQYVLDSIMPLNQAWKKDKTCEGFKSQLKIDEHDVILYKSMHAMNISGLTARKLASQYLWQNQKQRLAKHLPELIVVHDDLTTPILTCAWQHGGSSKGHNGLRDIDECLKQQKYSHIKLGIGRPVDKSSVADFVLDPLPRQQLEFWGRDGPGSKQVMSLIEKAVRETVRDYTPSAAASVQKQTK